MHVASLIPVVVLALCGAGITCDAEGAQSARDQWPRFRGPGGSGIGTSDFPVHFGPDSNVVWSASVPSGHSSPCIWADRLFLTGFEADKLVTTCLDRMTGQRRWSRSVAHGRIERGARYSHPATGTPATDGQRLFVYFGSFGLIGYSVTGEELWRKPLPVPVTDHGPGTSPVLAGERLFLNCDQDAESFLLAVDAGTGEQLWRRPRPGFVRGFSTPLLYPPEDPTHILVAGSIRLVAYRLEDGVEEWSIGGLPNEMVTSPVAGGGQVYVASWAHGSGVARMPSFDALLEKGDQDKDGRLKRGEPPPGPVRQHFHYFDADQDEVVTRQEYERLAGILDAAENVALAVRPEGKGDLTASQVRWRHTRGLPNVSSPLYYEGRLFFVKNGGIATLLNAETGVPFYSEERLGALGNYYASPVAAAGKIVAASQNGTVVVLRSAGTLDVLARNKLDAPILASPAVVGGVLYVRTLEKLWAFGE